MAKREERPLDSRLLGQSRSEGTRRVYAQFGAHPPAQGVASLANRLAPPRAMARARAPLDREPNDGLGKPINIQQTAQLIGCSPWTVRQTLIPRGLPFFRSGASGKLIFYTNQVVRWIQNQQGGNTTT